MTSSGLQTCTILITLEAAVNSYLPPPPATAFCLSFLAASTTFRVIFQHQRITFGEADHPDLFPLSRSSIWDHSDPIPLAAQHICPFLAIFRPVADETHSILVLDTFLTRLPTFWDQPCRLSLLESSPATPPTLVVFLLLFYSFLASWRLDNVNYHHHHTPVMPLSVFFDDGHQWPCWARLPISASTYLHSRPPTWAVFTCPPTCLSTCTYVRVHQVQPSPTQSVDSTRPNLAHPFDSAS